MKNSENSISDSIIIIIVIILSGIILGIANYYLVSPFGWICYAGLFYLIFRYRPGVLNSFFIGYISSIIQGFILFAWMGDVAERYSGAFGFTGHIVAFILSLVFALKSGVILAFLQYLIQKFEFKRFPGLIIIISGIASITVILDLLYLTVFYDLPWLYHSLGNTQANNLLSAQLSEIAGVWFITFILIIINFLFAYALSVRNIKFVYSAILLIIAVHIYGAVRIWSISEPHAKIKAALICDNTEPEIRWDEKIVNSYVNSLFYLNNNALIYEPDIIIWNEGVIPWTYNNEDDFREEITRQTGNRKTYQLLSYFTDKEFEHNIFYNTAYLFNNKGWLQGRYDKTILLGGLEKPLWGISALQFPLFDSNSTTYITEGNVIKPFDAKSIGNPGIIICNESLSDNVAAKLSSQGAGFLILIANNNWFSNTHLANFHFQTTRFRAIENRKDIAVNSNLGVSGIIDATGKFEQFSNLQEPEVISSEINIDLSNTNFNLRKHIFLIMTLLILLTTIIFNYEKN